MYADQRASQAFLSTESIVMNDDALRPQDTTAFKKNWQQYQFDFPNIHVGQNDNPALFDSYPFLVPTSTRADVENTLFQQRYGQTQ
jgi:hypothetical protein